MVYFSPEYTSIQKLLQNDIATRIDDRMRVDMMTEQPHTYTPTSTNYFLFVLSRTT